MDAAGGVTTLMDVLQLSPGDAQFLLQKFNNDAARAISEYLENPDILKQAQPIRGWDEPPPYHNTDVPGFRIDASDNVISSVRGAAPSRPPSRNSFHDEPIDLTAAHRAADPSKSLPYEDRDREELQMQEAIALSMGQPPPGQENGVTGTGQQFGPARGEYHDTQRWAMTVSKATAREIVDDPPPADRQRKPGEPAFLRPSARLGSETLAALLTIYHSIPLAREALLLPSYQQLNYGHDPRWWTGHPIEAPKILPLDETGAHRRFDDVIIETQRLMAFLDDTNRAYASVEALADMETYNSKEAESEMSRFLEAWTDVAMVRCPDDPLTQVFFSHGIRDDPGCTMDKYFPCLEPMVDPAIDQNFTDIIDSIIWSDQFSDRSLNDVWIDKIGEVLTLRLSDPKRKQGNLGVEIPAVWYPDRYMEHFREVSRNMRMRKRHIQDEIWRLDRSRNCILSCTVPGFGTLDIKKALTDAAERAPVVVKNQSQQEAATEAETMSSPTCSSVEVHDCVKALQSLVTSIETKVADIEKKRQKLLIELKATTARFTTPHADSPSSPFHRYTLRGLSTKPHITYVLRRAAEATHEAESERLGSTLWQWWRISISSEGAKPNHPMAYGSNPQAHSTQAQGGFGSLSQWPPSNSHHAPSSSQYRGKVVAYTICKVNEEDVLKAAREEDDSITLVYASDKAVSFQGSTLSGPLQMFVKADNKMFENELRGIEQPQDSDAFTNGEEMTQLHFSSVDGIGMQDLPLTDGSDETMHSERQSSLPPATISLPSARREADGQPSPKRPKGEEDGSPPHYDHDQAAVPEMQERSGGIGILGTIQPNRIGQHAEKIMEKIGEDAESDEKGL